MIPVYLFKEVVAYALVDPIDYDRLAAFAWKYKANGRTHYAQRNNPSRPGVLLMHRDIMHPRSGEYIDHINHDGLDNRRVNLRVGTQTQNMANCRHRKVASSQYKGVSWNSQHQRWKVQIGKRFVGYFNDEREAAAAYDDAARNEFGEFAYTNFAEAPPAGIEGGRE